MPQSYYKKPTFAIPRTIFRDAANNRKGYPQGKVMERAWRMPPLLSPAELLPLSRQTAMDTQGMRNPYATF